MIRVAYFSSASHLVTQILSGPNLDGFPEAEPGTSLALLLNDELNMPLYFDGVEFQPLPPAPSEGMVWHYPTETWVFDLAITISSHRERIEILTDFFLNVFGFSHTLLGTSTTWVVHTTERNRHRLQSIINQISMDAAGDAFIVFGVNPSDAFAAAPIVHELTVTRAAAMAYCKAYGARHQDVLRTRQHQLNKTREAEILGATDPTTALADMIELIGGGWVVPPPP